MTLETGRLALEDRIAELEAKLARVTSERDAYHDAFEQAPALMCLLEGPEHVYRTANDRYARVTGRRDLIGKPIREALPELAGQGIYEILDEVYATGAPFIGRELAVDLDRDGVIMPVVFDFIYQPVKNQRGDVTGIFVHAVDVTESVTARRALAETNAALEAAHSQTRLERDRLFDLSVDLVTTANAEDRLTTVNPAWTATLGWSAEELTSRSFLDFVVPDDQVDSKCEHDRLLVEGTQPAPFRNRFLTKDGGIRTLEWRSQSHGGQIYAIGRDVTERVEAETALREAHEALAEQQTITNQIIAHAPAALAFLDRELVFRWLNPAYGRMVGMAPEQLLGHSVFEAFGISPESALGDIMRGVIASGEPYSEDGFLFNYVRDGEAVRSFWDFTHTPVMGPDGAVIGLLNLSIEVSDRLARETLQAAHIETLRQTDRHKDEFLSVISHELRTPLNFIMGFASLLEDEVQGPLNDQQHAAMDRILAGADRMVGLVDDLLDVARMQAGSFRLMVGPTPFAPLVEQVLAELAPLAAQKGLSLAAEVAEAVPVLDGQRVVQVLTNLVANAVKFTDAGGVRVRAAVAGDRLVTEVIDTGCGIDSADMPRLFRRFSQLDMTATRKAGGTGLGLAITKALVEAHGGIIEVESAPGAGATFRFALPLGGP